MADETDPLAPEETLVSLGRNIQAYREMLRWSTEQLADRAGLNRSHIWKIEQGRSNPRLLTLLRITEALGCDLSDLMPGNRGFARYATRVKQVIDGLEARLEQD